MGSLCLQTVKSKHIEPSGFRSKCGELPPESEAPEIMPNDDTRDGADGSGE